MPEQSLQPGAGLAADLPKKMGAAGDEAQDLALIAAVHSPSRPGRGAESTGPQAVSCCAGCLVLQDGARVVTLTQPGSGHSGL